MERHRMDTLSLVFGLGFVAAGVALVMVELGFDDLHPASWWPIPVTFVGLWLLLAALNRTRMHDDLSLSSDAESDEPDDPYGHVEDTETEGHRPTA
jgi:hypothetical protein